MKYFQGSLILFLIFILTSCDHSIYVAVRNYKPACKVNVAYDGTNTFFNNDTLFTHDLDDPKLHGSIVRINTSPTSYSFIAPPGNEIGLRPQSFGQPIKQIEIMNSADSTWNINLWDRKQFKKLRKEGLIKIRRVIFISSIFIINK
ncbi:MAG TPA: hypothetical protein VK588_12770 [Chitinophagaceae bacterium]|nr:hypothetical protein [Chitinophagaceae bacterium]